MTWSETFSDAFKKNDVRFISYVRQAGRRSDPALIRSRFMKGLGTGRGGLLDA